MDDTDEEVCATAARSLGRNWDMCFRANLDPNITRRVVRKLVEALNDTRAGVREAAADGLGHVYGNSLLTTAKGVTGLADEVSTIQALAGKLDDASEDVRLRAVAAIGKIGAAYQVAPPDILFTALSQDSSTAVRAEAAKSLGHFQARLDAVTLALFAALDAKEPRIRNAAGDALRSIHELAFPRKRNVWPTGAIVPSLTAALASRNAEVRYHAAALLIKLGPETPVAIPALIVVLAEPVDPQKLNERIAAASWDPSVAAARALGRIAPGSSRSREAVTALIEVLANSESRQRRGEAAEALAMFGQPDGEPSIPVMLKVLSDANESKEPLGEYVARALGQLTPGTRWEMQAVSALTAALDAKWEYTRGLAAESLAKFGTHASPALPRLKAIAEKDESPIARGHAASAVSRILALENRPES